MAFTISVGYSTAPPNKVNRGYSVIDTVTISPLSVINQLSPVFVIDYDARFLNANYLIADFLSRKYFCTVSIDTAGRMVLSCRVDVLANDFSNCSLTVTRNGGIGKPTYIPDSKLPILPNKESITSTIAENSYFSDNSSWPPLPTQETYCYVVTTVNASIIV